MPFQFHNPSAVAAPSGNYAHGLEVPPHARYLFISGQIPGAEENDTIPDTFEAQCEAVWGNIVSILASANMTVDNLVKVTTFLTHRDQAAANSRIRQRVLGSHTPALTVIVAQTLDSAWLLEIEVIAADDLGLKQRRRVDYTPPLLSKKLKSSPEPCTQRLLIIGECDRILTGIYMLKRFIAQPIHNIRGGAAG